MCLDFKLCPRTRMVTSLLCDSDTSVDFLSFRFVPGLSQYSAGALVFVCVSRKQKYARHAAS